VAHLIEVFRQAATSQGVAFFLGFTEFGHLALVDAMGVDDDPTSCRRTTPYAAL